MFGDCDTVSRIIRIATKNLKGEKLSKEDLQLTLYHEIMHAICAEGEYGGINTDEPFIEWSAKCLFDLKEQKVI